MQGIQRTVGGRIRELRIKKGWNQEEFANVSGFHRTYVGQIERGENNISFENLIKLASVLSVTPSELLSVLDSGASGDTEKPALSGKRKTTAFPHQVHEIQKLLTRLKHQRSPMDRTLTSLEELMVQIATRSGGRSRTRSAKE